MVRNFLKDPDALLPYLWDWSAWLAGDTITTHTVTATTGLTVSTHSHTDTAVTAWLDGGTAGQSYTVTCHIVTAAGLEDDRSIELTVAQR
jgi:hypothetical protein